jgi:hypothetical protein
MSRLLCTASIVLTALIASPNTYAESTQLQDARLRSKLERIYYEQEFLIRNERVDRSDLKHQEKQLEALKVFERIPFREDLPGLRSGLDDSARERGLKLISLRRGAKARTQVPPVPSKVYSDQNPPFKLSEEQLLEKIPLTLVVKGERANVLAWMGAWREDQLRLTEPSATRAADSIRPAGPGRWSIQARTFRFREVKFPTLEPRDPLSVLPAWAQLDKDRFAKAEPLLWQIVAKTRAISPHARPLFRNREQMQLNAARMSVFLAKAGPPPRYSRN